MPKVNCINKLCDYYEKNLCTAEEIEIDGQAGCLTATDYNTIEEEIEFKDEGGE